MRRYAVDLLRREDWRRLLDLAAKPLTQCAQLFEGQIQRPRLRRRNAVRIKSIGRKAEANVAGIVLLRLPEELGQPGIFAQQQRQYPRSHRVQRPQVPYGFFARSPPDHRDHVMRSNAGWFINYKKSVHATSSLVAKTRLPAEPEKGTRSASATAT